MKEILNTGIVKIVTDITSSRMGLLKLKNHRLWLQRLQIQHHRTIRVKDGKAETVKEQTPDTGDNKRVFAWLLMFIIGGAAAGLTIKGKKTEN